MRADRPSATARMIAAATVAAYHDRLEPRPAPESVAFARTMLATSWIDRMLLRSVEWVAGRLLWRCIESMIAPGLVHHMARRKAWIERHCRAAIAEGFGRVVILGAGLDGLGTRLAASEPGVRVVEMDHPATQRIKRAAKPDRPDDALALTPIDLATEPVSIDLLGGDPSVDSVFIAEGLLMYLAPERVRALLDELATTRAPGARLWLILTFMEAQPGQPLGFRSQSWTVGRWLSAIGEPFRWGGTRDEVSALLAERGLRVVEMAGEADLAKEWPGRVLEGEVLVLAERGA